MDNMPKKGEKHFIYALFNESSHKVEYVGRSYNPWGRLATHRNPKNGNPCSLISMYILDWTDSEKEACHLENLWIQEYLKMGAALKNARYPGSKRTWDAGTPRLPGRYKTTLNLTEEIIAHLRLRYGNVSRGLRDLAEKDMQETENKGK